MNTIAGNLNLRRFLFLSLGLALVGIAVLKFDSVTWWPFAPGTSSIDLALEQPNAELSKLVKILDRYRSADFKVDYDGHELSPERAWRQGRLYLTQHMDGLVDAETWIRQHSYRTPDGNVIYFEYPDGSKREMREVFLEDLAELNEEKAA